MEDEEVKVRMKWIEQIERIMLVMRKQLYDMEMNCSDFDMVEVIAQQIHRLDLMLSTVKRVTESKT